MRHHDNPLEIENPNSSKQGHHPRHAENRYHETLVSAGYAYSHSTPIVFRYGVRIYHTYKHAEFRDLAVSVYQTQDYQWTWDASRIGSGFHTNSVRPLAEYLRTRHENERKRQKLYGKK